MANEFQIWLTNQGYYRKDKSLVWWKDGKIVDGAELSRKLNEWKAFANLLTHTYKYLTTTPCPQG